MLTSNNLVSILRQMSFIAIAGLGITFVIISGRIDLSVGSTITVTASYIDGQSTAESVTSAATATAEVVGSAGVLVDPTDSGSLAEGIRHLLDDAVAAGGFAAAGRARAGTLTWDAVAEQTVNVYRAVLAA